MNRTQYMPNIPRALALSVLRRNNYARFAAMKDPVSGLTVGELLSRATDITAVRS